ncbi:MAG: aminotransferase class V-fold PLP-dependent enzyme [Polyangiaceae bacterium]|nr:aminotransferase class V-fold PLP-dependent enzyme [Polyangiaceae bacterium]
MNTHARNIHERRALLSRFGREFLGLHPPTPVRTLDGAGATRRKVYLDATATSLMPTPVWAALDRYFRLACANSHTHAHAAGRETTAAIERARELVGELVGWDPSVDVAIFTGNGATGAANLLAEALFPAPPTQGRDVVLVSKMEHHSNMLPWMRAVGRDRVRFIDTSPDGTLDQACYRRLLEAEGARVAVVAVTGVSNVTGIINPVHELARTAHRAGAEIVVDAAQAAPHVPLDMHPAGDPDGALDYVIVSGHKLYAPGSRGVLIGRRDVFHEDRVVGGVGGGAVDMVSTEEVRWKADVAAREEAGTPNIPGTIALGVVAGMLREIGMDLVREHEVALVDDALGRLSRVPGVVVYGSADTARVPRAGVIAFNVRDLPHGLVAAALWDYFAIAVRNDCFCAQPYVKEQLQLRPDVESSCASEAAACDVEHKPGMVRASFGVFTTRDDVAALDEALTFIAAHAGELRARYVRSAGGDFTHTGAADAPAFSIDDVVAGWAAGG